MSDRELVLRERCGHGKKEAHNVWWNDDHMPTRCPGGSETVLDPERWLRLYCRVTGNRSILVKVQDVIDALGGSDE